MAKSSKLSTQGYPRLPTGLLDDSTLVPHKVKLEKSELKELITEAIKLAQRKSSRAILAISDDATEEEQNRICKKEGSELFKYFHKYVSDPAAMAHQIRGKHFRPVAIQQFRNRTLQKERMNSGWRYQFLAVSTAQSLKRFQQISDIGSAEGDFNAVIPFTDKKHYPNPLRLYVSVKNRSNTMGGQDWPKAIHALENYAKSDKNGNGPYCCVFGITIEKGNRTIRRNGKNGQPYSSNTEVWLADFFWPFFSTFSYDEVMSSVLEVLLESDSSTVLSTEITPPDMLLESFGTECRIAGIIDNTGCFHDPFQLVRFFVQPLKKPTGKSKKR